MSNNNSSSIEEDFLTEIEIHDYNHTNQQFYYSTPSNFSVNFTVNQIDRLILTSKHHDTTTNTNDDIILTKNNPPRVINQSTTLPFDPNNGFTWPNNLDFCLQFCLHLDQHVRREVLHKLATYVTLNPNPASLVVSINRVEEYEASLYDDSLEDNNNNNNDDDDYEETGVLKRTRVGDVEFRDNNGEEWCCSICLVNWTERKDVSVACMPCNHTFHDDCIVTWLKVSLTCPVCRFDLGQLLVLDSNI